MPADIGIVPRILSDGKIQSPSDTYDNPRYGTLDNIQDCSTARSRHVRKAFFCRTVAQGVTGPSGSVKLNSTTSHKGASIVSRAEIPDSLMSTVHPFNANESPGLDSDVNLNLEMGMATGVCGLIFRFQGLPSACLAKASCIFVPGYFLVLLARIRILHKVRLASAVNLGHPHSPLRASGSSVVSQGLSQLVGNFVDG
jgi:hypothetical protein